MRRHAEHPAQRQSGELTLNTGHFWQRSAHSCRKLAVLELCAGAGGQAIGFEEAGVEHAGLVEIDATACETLRLNRPQWNVIQADINTFDGASFAGIDILAAGLPCPPFSVAGKQLGKKDARNLFPSLLRLVSQIRPRAVMAENVRGIFDPAFDSYRRYILRTLARLGYHAEWKLLNASDFQVPQLRPRAVLVGVKAEYAPRWSWPRKARNAPCTVGAALYDLMAANNWQGARAWRDAANRIAPTVVGGSLKHGGPDLGPVRARRAWAALGVDGLGIADNPPPEGFAGMPRLTIRMAARLQGFPDGWHFAGGKTRAYRQVGNAFPPPVARRIAMRLIECLAASQAMRAAG